MEEVINKKDFKNLSRQFRRISGQFLACEDSEEAIRLLRRFINFIDDEPILKDYIRKNHTEEFDMKAIVESVQFGKYDIPQDINREVTFIYQLLRYTSENYDDYVSVCRGYAFYKGATFADAINKFNHQVVNLLINHITDHLEGISIDMGLDEKSNAKILVQGSVGQLNFSEENLETQQINNNQSNEGLIQLIDQLISELKANPVTEKEIQEDALDFLEDTQTELKSDEPKQSVFRRTLTTLHQLRTGVDDSAKVAQVADQVMQSLSQFQ